MTMKALLLSAAFTCIAGMTQAEVLNMAHPWAPSHPTATGGFEIFIKTVEAKTDGALTFKPIYGGGLLSSKEVLAGVESGIADVGMVVPPYFPAELPHGALLGDLAMFTANPYATGAAVAELNFLRCQACLDEFDAHNAVYLGTYSSPGYALMSKAPIESISDLKGLRIRAPGGSFDRWARSVSGVPVNIPGSDTYEALSRNILDIGMLPVGDLISFSLLDVVKHVNMVDVGAFFSYSLYTFNKDVWSKLSDDQRKILLEAGIDSTIDVADVAVKLDSEARSRGDAEGIVFNRSESIVEQLAMFRAEDIKTVVSAAEDRGVTDAAEFAETYRKLLKKYEALFEGKTEDPAAMKEILHREILSKIDVATYGM